VIILCASIAVNDEVCGGVLARSWEEGVSQSVTVEV